MPVYRVERTKDYTVMSNFHLKDTSLTLKAKGLLSMFLSFPDDWNYTTRGLATICKEGVEAIGNTVKELEKAGYIRRRQLRGSNGRITDTEYVIFERPRPQSRQHRTILSRMRRQIRERQIRKHQIRIYHVRETLIWLSRIWPTRIRKTARN